MLHIRKDSTIINNPDFENGIMKILDGREAAMTEEEETACSIFFKDSDEQEAADRDEEDLGYATSALRNSHQAKRARVGFSG